MKKLFLTLAVAVLTASFSSVPVLAAGGGDVVGHICIGEVWRDWLVKGMWRLGRSSWTAACWLVSVVWVLLGCLVWAFPWSSFRMIE